MLHFRHIWVHSFVQSLIKMTDLHVTGLHGLTMAVMQEVPPQR